MSIKNVKEKTQKLIKIKKESQIENEIGFQYG